MNNSISTSLSQLTGPLEESGDGASEHEETTTGKGKGRKQKTKTSSCVSGIGGPQKINKKIAETHKRGVMVNKYGRQW